MISRFTKQNTISIQFGIMDGLDSMTTLSRPLYLGVVSCLTRCLLMVYWKNSMQYELGGDLDNLLYRLSCGISQSSIHGYRLAS